MQEHLHHLPAYFQITTLHIIEQCNWKSSLTQPPNENNLKRYIFLAKKNLSSSILQLHIQGHKWTHLHEASQEAYVKVDKEIEIGAYH